MKEDKAEVKVVVPIRDLWKAMSSDLRQTIPKVLPGFVEEVELLEGDGGLGSLLLFKFGRGVPKVSYQKEKIVELDKSLHKFAIKVVEGGHLDHGFSSYTTAFKLQEVAESETLVEVKVLYETKVEDTCMPGESVKASLHYIKCLETYLLRQNMKEDAAQVTVSVPIKELWRAMATDNRYIVPKVLPDLVSEVELLEGDGGLGSMLLFKYWPHVPKVRFQRERIVEYNESLHQIALQILEGGHLDHGFTSYTNVFKLTELAEGETLIDMKLLYETKPEHTHIPGETLKGTFLYIKSLENYLLKGLS